MTQNFDIKHLIECFQSTVVDNKVDVNSISIENIREIIDLDPALKSQVSQILAKFEHDNSIDTITLIYNEFLGRGGVITSEFKSIIKIRDATLKRTTSILLNYLKTVVSDRYRYAKDKANKAAINEMVKLQFVDCTLTSNRNVLHCGNNGHPVMHAIERIHDVMDNLGFIYQDAPQIESDYYNFTALNIPEHHPSRTEHDTFYLDNSMILRSHTSNAQIRSLEKIDEETFKAGCKFYSVGKVYRRDNASKRHSHMFHQIEGLKIDKSVTFDSMVNDVYRFLLMFFERDSIPIRIRPSYFPFTEPSAEIDIRVSYQNDFPVMDPNGDSHIEVMGFGIVHPNVFNNCSLPDFPACAFGAGIERLVMFTDAKISDINNLYS